MVKKKSTKAIGNKFENECVKVLEEAGYKVMKSPRQYRCIGKNRWISSDNDYFNLFDICAKEMGGRTRWIQCKFGEKSNVSTAKTKIKPFAEEYMNSFETMEVWHRELYQKEISIYVYYKGETGWVRI